MNFLIFLSAIIMALVVSSITASPINRADDTTLNLDQGGGGGGEQNKIGGELNNKGGGVPDDLDTAALGNVYICVVSFGPYCGDQYGRRGRYNRYYGGGGGGWGRRYRSGYGGYRGWSWGK